MLVYDIEFGLLSLINCWNYTSSQSYPIYLTLLAFYQTPELCIALIGKTDDEEYTC